MEGVWIAPVTAQVMMTLRGAAITPYHQLRRSASASSPPFWRTSPVNGGGKIRRRDSFTSQALIAAAGGAAHGVVGCFDHIGRHGKGARDELRHFLAGDFLHFDALFFRIGEESRIEHGGVEGGLQGGHALSG